MEARPLARTLGSPPPSTTMNQHFRKRKARTSSAPVSPRRAGRDHLGSEPTEDSNAPPSTPDKTTEGVNLAAALTALKVSLKRDMESFIPPTPVASPIHCRSSKRARFEFGALLPEVSEYAMSTLTKASPAIKLRGSAQLTVSKKLQQELDQTVVYPDSSDHTLRARKRRQQLSYFAIASAFHRAAHERERPLVVHAQSVE